MKLKEWQEMTPELQNLLWEYSKYKKGYNSKIHNIMYGYYDTDMMKGVLKCYK